MTRASASDASRRRSAALAIKTSPGASSQIPRNGTVADTARSLHRRAVQRAREDRIDDDRMAGAEGPRHVDDVVCLATPGPFYAVAAWYQEFPETTDEDVRRLLAAAGRIAQTD
jgi:hypothetical protein